MKIIQSNVITFIGIAIGSVLFLVTSVTLTSHSWFVRNRSETLEYVCRYVGMIFNMRYHLSPTPATSTAPPRQLIARTPCATSPPPRGRISGRPCIIISHRQWVRTSKMTASLASKMTASLASNVRSTVEQTILTNSMFFGGERTGVTSAQATSHRIMI